MYLIAKAIAVIKFFLSNANSFSYLPNLIKEMKQNDVLA